MSRRPSWQRALALLLAALVLAACSYSGSHDSQVRQWVSSSDFGYNQRQVVSDAHAVELAAATGTARQLRTVCGGLSSDAGTLYGTLVTPDHRLTRMLARSMEDFFKAAESCAVVSSTTSSGATSAVARTRRGLAELRVADRLLRSFGIGRT